MIVDINFSEEITTIIQSSKHYNDQLKLTLDQILDISHFVHFYENENHLQFFKNNENILYGFCYGQCYGSTFWMFLDENYVFYDIKLKNNSPLSKKTRTELGNIFLTVEKLNLQYFDLPEKPEIKTLFDYTMSFFI